MFVIFLSIFPSNDPQLFIFACISWLFIGKNKARVKCTCSLLLHLSVRRLWHFVTSSAGAVFAKWFTQDFSSVLSPPQQTFSIPCLTFSPFLHLHTILSITQSHTLSHTISHILTTLLHTAKPLAPLSHPFFALFSCVFLLVLLSSFSASDISFPICNQASS